MSLSSDDKGEYLLRHLFAAWPRSFLRPLEGTFGRCTRSKGAMRSFLDILEKQDTCEVQETIGRTILQVILVQLPAEGQLLDSHRRSTRGAMMVHDFWSQT
jgi:hypothetical protein